MGEGASPRLSPIQDLACGALAGMSARMTVAPLDVVKIRLQVQSETHGLYNYPSVYRALRTIVFEEGIAALWKGNGPALFMVTPYSAIQLSSFYQLKQITSSSIPEPYSSLSIGAVSAAAATLFTYPLDLLRTRLAAQPEPKKYHGPLHAIRILMKEQGFPGLYAGLQPTMIQIVPYMAMHFALYEHLKSLVLRRKRISNLHPHQSMTVGAVAGTISKLVTLPLDNAKKIMQVQGQFHHPHQQPYRGVCHVLQRLWIDHGPAALYRGAIPSVLKAAPSSAVTFMVYEAAKVYFA